LLLSKKNIVKQREALKFKLKFSKFILYENTTYVDEICLIGIVCGTKTLEHDCIHLRQISSYAYLERDDDDERFLLRYASNTVESNDDENSERK